MNNIDEQKVINLLTDILNELKANTKEMTDLKNLFLRYDLEAQAEQMTDVEEE